MPRRKAAAKRKILPDPLYGSERLAKFINVIMRKGKKSIAEAIVYEAMTEVVKRLKKDKHTAKKTDDVAEASSGSASKTQSGVDQANLEALEKALHNIRPTVEVKSRRVGGATYQVPIEVDSERGLALAMRMLVKSANGRSEKTMVLRLTAEILDAHEGRGAAVKLRDDMHRTAKANQAFANYRF
jgi:small subunit ribosomal protein S7